MHAHPLETQQQTEEKEEHEVGRNISSPEVSSFVVLSSQWKKYCMQIMSDSFSNV